MTGIRDALDGRSACELHDLCGTREAREVRDLLPHRPPFLLVDRIVEMCPGSRAVCELVITGDEFWCQCHFPGYPVMPGVLLIEAMAQTAALAAGGVAEGKLPLLTGVRKARFAAQARPGAVLTIEAELGRSRGQFGTASGRVLAADGSKLAECELTFALLPQEQAQVNARA